MKNNYVRILIEICEIVIISFLFLTFLEEFNALQKIFRRFIQFVTLWIIFHIHWVLKRDYRPERKEEYLNSISDKTLPEDAPNIIIINCDDLGYGDISCFGAETIQTPNIDSLASNGKILSNFYASSSICSPSRAGLLTGRYPRRSYVSTVFFPKHKLISWIWAISLYTYGVKGIALDEIVIPEVLKKAGYSTGMLGKWHLGDLKKYWPNNFGFDYFYGALYSNDMKPYSLYENENIDIKHQIDQEIITKTLTDKGLAYIDRCSEEKKPFFLYYAQPFPHNPLHASKEFKGKSRAGLYGDAVQEVDWSVGKIIEKLKDKGLYDNTIIFFTSDNGPWHEGSPGAQRGRKYNCFDGGHRVPCIVQWPKKIKPGSSSEEICTNMDFLPTFSSILNISSAKDRIIDGKDISSLMVEEDAKSPHDNFYYHHNKKVYAVRKGKWKYHSKHNSENTSYFMTRPGPFLFNLDEDENESYSQGNHYPEIEKELADDLKKHRKSIKKNLRGWID